MELLDRSKEIDRQPEDTLNHAARVASARVRLAATITAEKPEPIRPAGWAASVEDTRALHVGVVDTEAVAVISRTRVASSFRPVALRQQKLRLAAEMPFLKIGSSKIQTLECGLCGRFT